MLRGAAAADAEVRAARLAPAGSGVQDVDRVCAFMAPFALGDADAGALAGKRPFDEEHLAVGLARDAAPLGVEPVDVDDQFFQSERNSPQCGRFCRTRNARRSASSRSYCSRVSAQRMSWKRR